MRYVYASLLVTLIGGGLWVFTEKESISEAPPPMAVDPASMNNVAVAVERSDYRTDLNKPFIKTASAPPQPDTQTDRSLQARLDAMQQRRAGQRYPRDAVVAAVTRHVAWTPTDEVPTSLPLKPEEFTDGRAFIKLDPLKMESLIPGDTFTVQLEKNGTPYLVEIDSVEVNDSERITWHGHLGGIADHYSVTFTRGKSLTVGGLDTPNGHFVLQAHGANGWIASSELLFKRNPDETDAIVPPIDGH